MAFASSDVVELHAANCRQAFRALRPGDTFVTSARGAVPCSADELDDDEVIGFARSDRPVERAANAMTARQVGPDAWRAYRDEASRDVMTRPNPGMSRSMRRAVAKHRDGEVPTSLFGISVAPPD